MQFLQNHIGLFFHWNVQNNKKFVWFHMTSVYNKRKIMYHMHSLKVSNV